MIMFIMENLVVYCELYYCLVFIVYSLFFVLIMYVYQMWLFVFLVQQVIQDRFCSCMVVLKEVLKVWFVGKMVYILFELIIGNKGLEEWLLKVGSKCYCKVY